MFIALYEFKIKPGHDQKFQDAWHLGTEGIYQSRGSFGSRLHKSEDGTYIAYAQWPSAAQYDNKAKLPQDVIAILDQMRACCEEVKLLHRMLVIDDLLK